MTEIEVLPPEKIDGNMRRKAENCDTKIREGATAVIKDLGELSENITRMRDEGLWRFLLSEDEKPRYKRFENYIKEAIGDFGRTKTYELMAITELKRGPKALSNETIKELGTKKAAEIARLPEQKRTQSVIKDALQAESVAEVKDQVRQILNEDLPPSERKEAGATLVRQLPVRTLARFEKLEERGIWLEGIRDGDKTLTMKQKLFHAIVVKFEEVMATELEEADEYKKKAEALEKENAKAAEAAAEAKKAAAKAERADKKKSAEKKPKAKKGKTTRRRLVSAESA